MPDRRQSSLPQDSPPVPVVSRLPGAVASSAVFLRPAANGRESRSGHARGHSRSYDSPDRDRGYPNASECGVRLGRQDHGSHPGTEGKRLRSHRDRAAGRALHRSALYHSQSIHGHSSCAGLASPGHPRRTCFSGWLRRITTWPKSPAYRSSDPIRFRKRSTTVRCLFHDTHPNEQARPVGSIAFPNSIHQAIEGYLASLAGSAWQNEVRSQLESTYRPAATFAESFGRLMAQLFRDLGPGVV